MYEYCITITLSFFMSLAVEITLALLVSITMILLLRDFVHTQRSLSAFFYDVRVRAERGVQEPRAIL